MERKELVSILRDLAIQVESGECPEQVYTAIGDTIELHTNKPVSSVVAIKYVKRMIGYGRSMFYKVIRPKLDGTKRAGDIICFTKKEIDDSISGYLNSDNSTDNQYNKINVD